MPTVTELELLAVDLPFRAPFRHAAASRHSSESLFLRARLDTGVEGWGESLPRVYVSGESRDDAFALLRGTILPALLGRTFQSLSEVSAFLGECDGKAPSGWVDPDIPQCAAWCSVDLALIDAFGKQEGKPAHFAVGGTESYADKPLADCRFSGVVSADRGWRYVISLAKVRAFGFPQVKLKVEPDGALQAAKTARRFLGRRVDLRVDANMAWDVEQALINIAELRAAGVTSFEQPIAANDLTGLARLVRETAAPIIVDEGLTDQESLQALIKRQACTGANVRISKCGGLVGAHARCREALDAGLLLQVGCQVGESSLLSAAQVSLLSLLAPLRPGVRYIEGCFGRHLLREDPASPLVQFRYGGRPPRHHPAAGLGMQMDQAKLRRWVVREARLV
jgi:L-Ala-D/L-Glu epimerase